MAGGIGRASTQFIQSDAKGGVEGLGMSGFL